MSYLRKELFVLLLIMVAVGGCSLPALTITTGEPGAADAPTESPQSAAETPETTRVAPQETEPTPLKVVTLPFLSFAPFYIGIEEGYFADHGLEIELVNMTVQRDIVPALISGEVDVASGLVSAGVLNAIARGGELKFVADKGYIDPNGCDNYALIARQALLDEVDFSDPAVWDGLRVDVVPATWLEYYLDRQMEAIGVSPAVLVESDLPANAEMEALAQGGIDVTLNNEPWVTILGNAGHQPILSPVTELMADSQSAVMFYGPNLLNGDPDIGSRFMMAYLQSVRQYNEGKTPRNLEILLKHLQINPDLLENICWPALRDDGTIHRESVLDFQTWAVDQGIMDAALEIDEIYDPRFVEVANEWLSSQ